jgi:hypothetical protein
LDLLQIMNLIIPMDGCKTSPVKSNLSFPGFLIVRNLVQRGFNEVTNGRGRRKPFARSPLIAEETAVTATYSGKKNGYDQWIRAYITFHLKLQILDFRFQISGFSVCNLRSAICNSSRAFFAASCSASFLLFPHPSPFTSSPIVTDAWNLLS